MQVSDALAGSFLPRPDAEVLLSRLLGQDRAWLLTHSDQDLTEEEVLEWGKWLERRRKHEPVAYIIGEQEFYGRVFSIDKRALIPRPATEGIVRSAVQFVEDRKEGTDDVDTQIVVVTQKLRDLEPVQTIVDIGTGSGAIAITLALERPNLRIIATDISSDALSLAKENAERHGVTSRITFLQGDCLAPIKDLSEPFLLVSNPPYIPRGNTLMPDVAKYEPEVALYGGESGKDILEKILAQAKEHPFCVGVVMERMI